MWTEFELLFSTEMKLAELSKAVGSYEKMRFEDQHVIQALKNRLSQLDVANETAAKQQATEHDNNQTSELEEQVLKLKGLIRFAWNKTETNHGYFGNFFILCLFAFLLSSSIF